MPTVLSISNKIFSIKGRMFINDVNGDLRYDATGSLSIFKSVWTISRGEHAVAKIRRKSWSAIPTWNVHCRFGDFSIKRKSFSWRRKYVVVDGPFDSTLVKGSIWGDNLDITLNDESVASADGKFFTLRDTHAILVHDRHKHAELFTTIVMVTLLLDRKSERRKAEDAKPDF